MSRGTIAYLPESAEDAEKYMGMSFYDYLSKMGINASTADPQIVENYRHVFYENPESAKRQLNSRTEANYTPPPDMDYRAAMNASRGAALGGFEIPGSYDERSSLYGGLSNTFLNPNTQKYTDMDQDILGMLYTQATNPNSAQYQNLSKMINQNADQVSQATKKYALSTGLNQIATNRLANQSKNDYLRTANDQANLFAANERSMAEQLALSALGSRYAGQAQGAIDSARRMSEDQKSKESIYLDQMQALMGVSDEQRRMDQLLAQQRAKENQQIVGAGINAAAQAGASWLANK